MLYVLAMMVRIGAGHGIVVLGGVGILIKRNTQPISKGTLILKGILIKRKTHIIKRNTHLKRNTHQKEHSYYQKEL